MMNDLMRNEIILRISWTLQVNMRPVSEVSLVDCTHPGQSVTRIVQRLQRYFNIILNEQGPVGSIKEVGGALEESCTQSGMCVV